MPRAVWGTPKPASATGLGYVPEDEPRGLLDFISGGSGNDVGAELGDRMGVIAQILMAAGSGRGGAGIAEASAAANERSKARREERRDKEMVNRMADKLEPSNPEMAMMMRANTKFGLTMLGRQLENQWDSESDLTKLKKQYEYEATNADTLERTKAKLKADALQARMNFLTGRGGATATADAAPAITPAPAIADAGVVPPPTDGVGGGGGGGGGPAPVVTQPQQTPSPAPTGGVDYTVGLTNNPQLRQVQLDLRRQYDDPELPIEDVQLILDSAYTDTSEGANTARKNIAERKARRARVQGIQTRGEAANATFQAAQGLPGIDMSAPGEMEMRGAGIDPKLRPDLNPAQTAERMRVAAETGDEQYNSLLGNLAHPPTTGALVLNPDTHQFEVVGGGAKDTEGDKKAAAYYNRGKASIVPLLEPAKIAALTSPALATAASVPLIGNLLTSGSADYQIADTAAKNFLISILRPDTGATINPDEEALYRSLFIPQPGDGKERVEFKAFLREQALEGVRINQSKEKIAATAADAWKTFKPPEGSAQAPAVDPAISALLEKYKPQPAVAP